MVEDEYPTPNFVWRLKPGEIRLTGGVQVAGYIKVVGGEVVGGEVEILDQSCPSCRQKITANEVVGGGCIHCRKGREFL